MNLEGGTQFNLYLFPSFFQIIREILFNTHILTDTEWTQHAWEKGSEPKRDLTYRQNAWSTCQSVSVPL